MIVLSFIGSPEFYVLVFTAAAAVVGLCVRPSSRGASATYVLQGLPADLAENDNPAISAGCRDDGSVVFTRSGLLLDNGDEVSYLVTVCGFDISIEEHILRNPEAQTAAGTVTPSAVEFTIRNLARERYHVKFESRQNSLLSVFTLTVREGFTAGRQLTH